jgi:hypothetical protein
MGRKLEREGSFSCNTTKIFKISEKKERNVVLNTMTSKTGFAESLTNDQRRGSDPCPPKGRHI